MNETMSTLLFLEVFNVLRYINLRFTYLFTYLDRRMHGQTDGHPCNDAMLNMCKK